MPRRLWRRGVPRFLWTRGRHDGRGLGGVVGRPGFGGTGLRVARREDLLEHFPARRRRLAGQALRVGLVDDDVGAVGIATPLIAT